MPRELLLNIPSSPFCATCFPHPLQGLNILMFSAPSLNLYVSFTPALEDKLLGDIVCKFLGHLF